MEEKIKKRKFYNLNDLAAAKKVVESKEMTVYKAAIHFKIPETTLYDAVKNKWKSNLMGKTTRLNSDEEDEIASWIFTCAKRGYPRKRSDVLQAANDMLKRKFHQKVLPITEYWLSGFLKRHPSISFRTTSKVSRASAIVSENNIRGWHREVSLYFTENDLLHIIGNHPGRIYNGDESGFQLVPDIKNKAFALRGSRYVLEIASGKEKVSVTAMFTIVADGTIIPPMMVYKNTYKMLEIARKMPRRF